MQQAAVRFGREFLNAFEASKKDKGIDWYLEPVPRGRNENGEITYLPRNTSIPRWASNTTAQGLGVSPFEGVERNQEVTGRVTVARQWAEQYSKVPGIQDSYKELMRILEEQRGIARDESLPPAARRDIDEKALKMRKDRHAHTLGTLHDKMRAHENADVRRLWEDTTKILKLPRMPFPPDDEGGLNDMGNPASPRTGPSGGAPSGVQPPPSSNAPQPAPSSPRGSGGPATRAPRTVEERERRSPGRTRSANERQRRIEQLQTNPNFRERFLKQLATHRSQGNVRQIEELEGILEEAFGSNYAETLEIERGGSTKAREG